MGKTQIWHPQNLPFKNAFCIFIHKSNYISLLFSGALKIYEAELNCVRSLVMLHQVNTRERFVYDYVCVALAWVLDMEFELTT